MPPSSSANKHRSPYRASIAPHGMAVGDIIPLAPQRWYVLRLRLACRTRTACLGSATPRLTCRTSLLLFLICLLRRLLLFPPTWRRSPFLKLTLRWDYASSFNRFFAARAYLPHHSEGTWRFASVSRILHSYQRGAWRTGVALNDAPVPSGDLMSSPLLCAATDSPPHCLQRHRWHSYFYNRLIRFFPYVWRHGMAVVPALLVCWHMITFQKLLIARLQPSA